MSNSRRPTARFAFRSGNAIVEARSEANEAPRETDDDVALASRHVQLRLALTSADTGVEPDFVDDQGCGFIERPYTPIKCAPFFSLLFELSFGRSK